LAGEVIREVFEHCSDDWPAGLETIAATTVDRLARRWTEGDTTLDEREAVLVAASLVHKGTRDRVMILLLDHDPTVLEALFAELARRTPDVAAAPVCTVLAWFSYAGGDGALAAVAAERALRVQPGYVLAELVLEGLDGMQPPAAIWQVTANVRAQLEGAS
jgi:hypothetical protein